MGRTIIKIHDEKTGRDYYLEWSNISEAPTTFGFDLKSFTDYYQKEYGNSGMKSLYRKLTWVEKNGTSDRSETIQHYYDYNCAGEESCKLDKEGLLDKYCRKSEYYQE